MSAKLATADAAPSWTAPAQAAAPARPFASVEVYARLADARADWGALEPFGSPYQSYAFCLAWAETVGKAEGLRPLVAVARDAVGAPLALLPLGLRSIGPLREACLLGGRMANYQMGLFHADALTSRDEVKRFLRAVAAAARPRIDVFAFTQQPDSWRGIANPLIALGSQPSPSFAFASDISAGGEAWREAHFSKATQKKLRKKAAKLEAFGAVRLETARDAQEIEACLDAFLRQKRERMREMGIGDEFERPDTVALLRRLSGLDGAERVLEWRAWRAGERFAALFAGLPHHGRLSGLVLSHDREPALAAASPGEQLILAVAQKINAEGFDSFDLGVGEARYKNECCEIVEPLFDVIHPLTSLGRAAAVAYRLARSVKRQIKQSPRLFERARHLRWNLRGLRSGT